MQPARPSWWGRRVSRWLLVLEVLISAYAGRALGQDFYVKGEVEYRNYSAKYTREFEFYVKGKAWQVRVSRNLPDIVVAGPKTMPDGRVNEPPIPPGRKVGDTLAEEMKDLFIMGAESLEEHYHLDCHSGYYAEFPAVPRPGQLPLLARPPGKRSTDLVSLYPGPVPWESREPVLPYLWLAYGSGPYFASLKTNMVKPFYHQWAQRWGYPGYQQEARWRLADTVPRLPVEVTYYNPGKKLEREVVNGVTTTNLIFVPYSAPYNTSFSNAHYTVISQTNIGGLTLPTEFQFDEYVPAGRGAVRSVRTVRGRVQTLYSYCPKKELRLEFPTELVVLDERIRTNPDMSRHASYKSTRLLTTNEAVALLERKHPPAAPKVAAAGAGEKSPQQPAVSAATKGPPKPRPWWERVLAVVALGVPLGVVWWRFYRRGAGASAPPAK